jgi:hypothetical protein
MTNPSVSNDDDTDSKLMKELRIKDEKLNKEMYDAVLDPKEMLNVLLKKLQLYNETEPVLKQPNNKLIVGFMKIAIEKPDANHTDKKRYG